MYKKMASLVITIAQPTTTHEKQLMTYTNSDPDHVMDEVKR
jgi:hypothetical protein